MIDMQRRKRVMSRSIKLGHCICDPKQPCPCPLFKEKNICMCAGERLDSPTGPVKLTQLVEKAGCASKIDQKFLKDVLGNMPTPNDPNVLVGVPAGDDAGIYDIGGGRALVQTVDVFTPSVDDPYMFGQVAAANSVSDVYAMGGTPLTALSVIGFPVRKVPDDALNQILQGGIDKMKEAGVSIIGGHSINDAEIKAGFAVTGMIDKSNIMTNAGAMPGDVLILTKPLGTGVVAFAKQIGRVQDISVAQAEKAMTSLNKVASELMVEFGAHAATDVTGFSLMGHLSELARRSNVDIEIIFDKLPVFEGVLEYAAMGILPGAVERNKASCGEFLQADPQIAQEFVDICFDAQTSGGLLIAIEPKKAEDFLSVLHQKGITDAAAIGKVTQKGKGTVYLKNDHSRKLPEIDMADKKPKTQSDEKPPQSEEVACCADVLDSNGSNSGEMQQVKNKFKEFLGAASSPHGLDAYTKQAMAIALSVATRCEDCLKMHIANAKKKGFSEQEIDEAAWMAISFAGSPAMVFYEKIKKQVTG